MVKATLFSKALARQNDGRPPVWFMRQAGRYHQHYQALRAKHGFVELCKVPELACEVTMGPIRDFDFDAAILFSDILFPLETMGMPLVFNPGPQFGWQLRKVSQLAQLDENPERAKGMLYQQDALHLLKAALPEAKGLIGFVGAPLTLYVFAVEGSHRQGCADAIAGFHDGRFDGFIAKVLPVLLQSMRQQAAAGIDALALFDTCAGELDPATYAKLNVPILREVMRTMRREFPHLPLIYYGKNISYAHWRELEDLDFQCLGVDWQLPLKDVLERYGDRWAIQGNLDPHLLRDTPPQEFPHVIDNWLKEVAAIPASRRRGWVCGLGHGVLPLTPEQNVRSFIAQQHKIFST